MQARLPDDGSDARCSANAPRRDCTAAVRHQKLMMPRNLLWRPSAPLPAMHPLLARLPLWPRQMVLPPPMTDSRCQTMATPHVGQ